MKSQADFYGRDSGRFCRENQKDVTFMISLQSNLQDNEKDRE